jgi:myo-inositol-1(or 4)-monophosphatase
VIALTEARLYLSELVRQAGGTLQRYFVSGNFSSRQKDGVDFTTQADEDVDAFLREHINRKYPHTSFLTEETAPSDYSLFSDTGTLWIIDPLDGTINFSRKNRSFAISIALVNKGRPTLGVVYLPMTQDLYWAQANKDTAYLNGEPIHVSSTGAIREAVVACDWAWDLEKRLNVVRWLGRISLQVRQISSTGSAVAALASLAGGKIDAYIHSGVKPWDVAASALLIEKAGGMITTPTGAHWNVFHSDILASNGNDIIYKQILAMITDANKNEAI